jgi:acetyl esterase/lipase
MIWFPVLLIWLFYLLWGPRIELFGYQIPTLVFDPIKIVKLNIIVLEMIYSYITGPPIQIAFIHLHNWFFNHSRIFKAINPKIDVYPQHSTSPVIIFIYGGAWNSGSKRLYSPIAHNLQESGYCVVMVDYTLWPFTKDPKVMTRDIHDAIEWTLNHIQHYGGNPNDVTIVAHSAGAHLVTLSLLEYAFESIEQNIPPYQSSLKQWESVRGMILMAGPFDIRDHFAFESGRGVEEISCMGRLFSPYFEQHSPSYLLRNHPLKDQVLDYLPKSWLLLHSLQDTVVPFSSSSKLYDSLERLGVSHLVLKGEDDKQHAKHVFDLFLKRNDFMHELNQFYTRCNQMGI